MLRSLAQVLGVLGVMLGAVVVAVARGETPVEAPRQAERVPSDEASHHERPDAGDAATHETWLGVVVPLEQVEIAAPLGARIEAVHVRFGQQVEAGEVLVTLDRRGVAQALVAARASLAGLRAAASEAELARAKARDTHARTSELGELVAEEERTAAALDSEAAKARVDRAAANVDEQRAKIAELEALEHDGEVRAPFAGSIALRHVDAGAFAGEGTPLLELVSAARLVRLALPSEHARVGVDLRLTCGERIGDIEIDRVAPQIDPASGLVLVEAELDARLQPSLGEVCEARLRAGSR
jgi:multidrug efflux pump subunit AcrA (membrane-fusion protein)